MACINEKLAQWRHPLDNSMQILRTATYYHFSLNFLGLNHGHATPFLTRKLLSSSEGFPTCVGSMVPMCLAGLKNKNEKTPCRYQYMIVSQYKYRFKYQCQAPFNFFAPKQIYTYWSEGRNLCQIKLEFTWLIPIISEI